LERRSEKSLAEGESKSYVEGIGRMIFSKFLVPRTHNQRNSTSRNSIHYRNNA
jgi:hypothetical protein